MAGIIVNIDGKEVNVVNVEVRQEEFDCPTPLIYMRFQSYINNIKSYSYDITLTGEDKTNFYARWNNHREVYVELCKQQNWDESVIPEDMDGEIVGY